MSIYLDYFGLTEPPFAITPDPRYVYLSRRHEDALAHLLYGIGQGGSGGFVQLTGEVGTGKTTLCRCLLEQIPAKTRIALILNPMLKPRDLLQAICDELGLQHGRSDSSRELVNRLYAHLLKAHADGERVVLVIDEAQNMSRDSLEQVRLLTNLETPTDKLLQIILLGQPELRELLARQELRQLAQRITARYHLQPLDSEETEIYVRHRLAVAGCKQPIFKRGAYKTLYQLSGGVPRLINILADRALMGAYASDSDKITSDLIKQAGREVSGDYQQISTHWFSARPWLTAALAAVLISASYAGYRMWPNTSNDARLTETTTESLGSQSGQSQDTHDSPSGSQDIHNLIGSEDRSQDSHDSGLADGADQDLAIGLGQSLSQDSHNLGQSQVDIVENGLTNISMQDWLNTAQSEQLWSRWAGLWRLDQARITQACEQLNDDNSTASENLPVTGVFCTQQPGGWSRIRQLNLPVLIELNNNANPLLVEGLGDREVLLHNGAQRRWWPISELRDRWSGGYTAVCPGSVEAWRQGMQAAEIQRLKQLASELPEQPYRGALDEQYSVEFSTWIAGFQTRNGLASDSVLGQESKLFLCAASAGTPRLLTSSAANLLAEGE